MPLTKEQGSYRTEALELLQGAMESLEETYQHIQQASWYVRQLPTHYNMPGNMESYVLNYIKYSNDSLVEKLEGYIKELNNLEEEDKGA